MGFIFFAIGGAIGWHYERFALTHPFWIGLIATIWAAVMRNTGADFLATFALAGATLFAGYSVGLILRWRQRRKWDAHWQPDE